MLKVTAVIVKVTEDRVLLASLDSQPLQGAGWRDYLLAECEGSA